MAEERHTRQTTPPQSDPAMRPGGYHSRGVPGEEAEVRKLMRVRKRDAEGRYINKSRPLEGGRTAQSTSAGRLQAATSGIIEEEGPRLVYTLARKGTDRLETPVFHAGESEEEEAVAFFTDREEAIRDLQVAGWQDTHEPAALSPIELANWLEEARAEGVRLAVVNLDYQKQLRGDPQPVLFLEHQGDWSGDYLYRELRTLAAQS